MINNDGYGGESVQKNAPAAPLDVSIGLVFHINLQPVIVLRRGLLFCRLHLACNRLLPIWPAMRLLGKKDNPNANTAIRSTSARY